MAKPQHPTGESRLWRLALRGFLNGAPTGVMRQIRRHVREAPIEEFVIVGRRTGRERRLLLSLVDVGGVWYAGHPNGTSQWVRNLEAAGGCTLIRRDGIPIAMAAVELAAGPERDAVIAATGTQPAPAGPIYRAAQAHIRASGRYFRLTPLDP